MKSDLIRNESADRPAAAEVRHAPVVPTTSRLPERFARTFVFLIGVSLLGALSFVTVGGLVAPLLAGPSGFAAVIIAGIVALVGSLVSAGVVASQVDTAPQRFAGAILVSLGIRFAITLVLGLSLAEAGWVARDSLLISVAAAQACVLGTDTLAMVRLFRSFATEAKC